VAVDEAYSGICMPISTTRSGGIWGTLASREPLMDLQFNLRKR